MDDKKIAVLIDAENVSGKYIKLILDEVSNYGSATYKRLYGDFQTPSVRAWMKNLRDYAITPVFQYNYTQGKNASDSALIIDAMDILYSGNVDGGGSVGLDVVEYFAPRGAECTIVDMLPQIGMMADPITKCSMRETHDKYGVKEYVNTALQEVKENAFTVKLPDGTIEDLNFELGFNCLGMRANNPILAQLEEAFDNTDTFIYPIGDSVRARRIMEGTMEGRAILNVLEARGFLELAPLE